MKIQEAYVTYQVGMLLKRVGFDEWCRLCYTTAIRHNGKDLSFDEELDLKGEGRANEIELTPGGWCEQHNNRNSEDFMSSNQDCCSCPSLQVAVAWVEHYFKVYVMPFPQPNGWKVALVYTDNPHPKDGRFALTELDDVFKSHVDAGNYGLKWFLERLQPKIEKV